MTLVGCQTKIKPEGEQDLRMCPRCHNGTVFAAKSTTWFELFWIPIVPISKKKIWICGTCQWRASLADNNAPQPAINGPAGAWVPSSSYQPVYIQTAPKV